MKRGDSMSDASILIFIFLFAFVCYVQFIEHKLWADIIKLSFYLVTTFVIAVFLIYDRANPKIFEVIAWILLVAGCLAVYITAHTIKYRMIKKSYR